MRVGSFCEAVQKGSVVGPLRRQFTVAKWDKAFSELGGDESDQSLHMVGRLVYAKGESIRSALTMTLSRELNATTKLRSLVATANHNAWALKRKTDEIWKKKQGMERPVLVSEFASIKVPLAVGAEFTPDEIIQSMVDGVQLPLKLILESGEKLAGVPKFGPVNWDDVRFDFNLGNLYVYLEQIWDDCLWNGYQCRHEGEGYLFLPESPFWKRLLALTRARYDMLMFQFLDAAENLIHRVGREHLLAKIKVREVKAVRKDGRRQTIKLSAVSELTEAGKQMFTFRLYASEPYYQELLSDGREKLGGGSVNDLLDGWSVIVSASRVLRDQLDKEVLPEEDDDVFRHPAFAPVLQRHALIRAVAEATGIPFDRARWIVDFLTYRGSIGQELWAQPLVPVSDEALAPVFAATTYANVRRLVDVWLQQLEVDMGLRGPAFEQFVRAEIGRYISASQKLGKSCILDRGLTLRPPNDRAEEIDVVFTVGRLVFLGEVKCSVQPTEAKQIAFHRKLVVGAVAQISRKAEAVKRHRGLFRTRMNECGIEVPEDFEVLHLVILNGPIHAGIAVNDVPVVDLDILSVFFSGELVDLASRTKDGAMEHLLKRALYADEDDAGRRAPDYFRLPTQMESYIRGLRERVFPIPPVSTGDWGGDYLAFECNPTVEHLLPSGGGEEASHVMDVT